jgi:hypothetical protein
MYFFFCGERECTYHPFFSKKRPYLSLNSYLYFMRIRERLHNLPTVIH